MSKEAELKNLVQRGIHTRELLDNPLMQEFYQTSRADLLHAFESTKSSDDEERHSIWCQSQALNKYIGKFEKAIRQGEKAAQALTEVEQPKII